MPDSLAERFTGALDKLERDRDLEPIVTLFSPDAEVGNVIAPEKFHGTAGARDFWTKYRDTFEEIHSTFRNRIDGDRLVALEWTTEATSAEGKKLHYDGVSILEFAGDKITRFRAYFDAGALGRQLEDVTAKGAHS